ncbi:hypothetical protein QWJ07_21700 [Frankia sp. RB7]|nr:hypothetical protein [Frankia sp. RB7]
MKSPPSKLNETLAGSVESRVAAEMFLIAGKSGFWRAVGIGAVGLGLGVAVGLGFYGYSFVLRNEKTLVVLSTALSKSLSEVHLRGTASGTVKFEPNSIALAPGQTVALDPTSRVHLDPNAKVLADGEVKIQMPTISVPQASATRPKSTAPTIANFTVFKSVPYEKGSVQTGWRFLTSAQRVPTTQYCYYQEKGDNPDVALRIEVGLDEKSLASKTLSKSFDITAAYNKCVWFKKDAL